jgi:DNA mismatch repair ATPase MutS
VLLDEICRVTSTNDGYSIAKAVVESSQQGKVCVRDFLHHNISPDQRRENTKEKNYHNAIKEEGTN